ncbi:hypothetical protein LINPERHAP2_LOCUS32253 [Linum perenne]
MKYWFRDDSNSKPLYHLNYLHLVLSLALWIILLLHKVVIHSSCRDFVSSF